MSDTREKIQITPFLERIAEDHVARVTLERAAKAVESLEGNAVYTQAWRLAARAIRRMKPD